ncbi:MAG: cation-transporting P-type ATPase [Patescibacteria group bacterium]|jgi:Mg2+-importing ATPase
MSFEKYTALTSEQTLSEFSVTPEQGQSESYIRKARQKYGPNAMDQNKISPWILFGRQFKSAFIYLLLAAALITFLLKEYLDSAFIIVFVTVNVLLGFFQEYKSEQTVKLLKRYTNKRATVIRDGKEQVIDSSDLVPGDIVVIETGDIVSADLRIIKTNNLLIDESTLTGESMQIRKQVEQFPEPVTSMYKSLNIAFSGTTVVEGKGIGVVIATGKDAQFGKIAKLVTAAEETSSFEKQINKFSKFILFLTATTLVIVFIVHIFFRHTLSITELTIYSIALAVGVIPEAMPLVTTFSLSIGASRLAKKKVVVKRLSSIEDLGSIQVLCTDKTGTITENKLTVSDIFSDHQDETILSGLFTSESLGLSKTSNNAFDLAFLAKASQEQDGLVKGSERLFEIPFNPIRRRNSVLVRWAGKKMLIVRGAVESVMPYVAEFSSEENEKLMSWVTEEGKKGRRIIAIASKEFDGDSYSVRDEEEGLRFLGAISFEDPIKESTHAAVKKAKSFGIQVKILTGDSADVAAAVALEVGISENLSDVITGDEFDKLTRAKQKEVMKRINVFARMSPEQKYYLVKLLQEDLEVGFLGEGINDAPALKAAGVSIVVDGSSDVARDVADIILLKHNLQVIVDGIEMGRNTFVNVTNYIKATLASNFGNFYAMAFVTLIIDYLPMLPLQILLVNLLSDFPMISIATDNVDKKDITSPKSYAIKELLLLATLLGLVSTGFDFMMFGIFKQYGASTMQTYWFIGSILTELAIIYSVRTRGWFFHVKNVPSKAMLFLTLIAAILTVGIPFTVFGVEIFKFVIPSWDKLALLFAIVAGYMASTEIVKRLYYKYLNFSR